MGEMKQMCLPNLLGVPVYNGYSYAFYDFFCNFLAALVLVKKKTINVSLVCLIW